MICIYIYMGASGLIRPYYKQNLLETPMGHKIHFRTCNNRYREGFGTKAVGREVEHVFCGARLHEEIT